MTKYCWGSSAITSPLANKMPRAMGRSKAGPSLRKSAGARLMTTLYRGNSYPEFCIALRTRSMLSFTAASGSPTTVALAKPRRATSTSTSTRIASIPENVALIRRATMTRALYRSLAPRATALARNQRRGRGRNGQAWRGRKSSNLLQSGFEVRIPIVQSNVGRAARWFDLHIA